MEEIRQRLENVRKSYEVLEKQLTEQEQGATCINSLHKHLSNLYASVESLKEDIIQSENSPIRYNK